MSTKFKSFFERLLTAVKVGDVDAIAAVTADAAAEETPEEKAKREAEEKAAAEAKKTGDTLAALMKTVDALVQKIGDFKFEKKDDDEDDETEDEKTARLTKEKEAADAAKKQVGDAMKDFATRAELIAPGFTTPTADSVLTLDAVADLQRAALIAGTATADGRKLVDAVLAGRDVATLTADSVDTVFIAASEMARTVNNARGIRNGVPTRDFGKTMSVADINARNSTFWEKQS